ncbi:DUF368 domain-containing protein [Euzebya rosea]|uniref:DUF368 domain-containing protein n=1 Tax=Euzebya rosea TaxID=2052804 RepID=UPI00130017B3|nr:DUF368 domain-containing protein [Euzebya rosea]
MTHNADVAAAADRTSDDRAPSTLGLRVLQGMAMGTADVIPGVSGGTVALILGIYTRLIGAIRTLAQAPTALVRGDVTTAGARVRGVPWPFVLPVGIGMLLALGLGSVVLPPLLEAYPVQTSALFFGLIVGSLSVPWSQAIDANGSASRTPLVALVVVFAVAAFLLTGLPEIVIDHPPLWRVFLSASVAICAMILPGVSGAFLLLALGIYEPTLEAAGDLDLPYLATFAAGAVVGLGAFSRLLSHLLEHRLAVTMAALTGLMVGALRVLWPWNEEGVLHGPASAGDAIVALLVGLVGFAIVRGLLLLGRRTGHPAEHTGPVQ